MTAGVQGSATDAIASAVDWLTGAIEWLGNLLGPVGEILAGIWPPVLAVLAAIVLLRTVRWLLLLWRGRTPRVQISNFAWAMSDDASREATWVTSLFREQLAALRLDALDPLPERAPGAPLVEIVEGVGQGVGRDIGAAAARLFRAAWPDSAYEVWGTLRPREGGGRISVQLIERRRGNRTLLNIALEEASWEDGAREAALAVAGALYPQIRKRDRGPWTAWKRTIPRQLMGHYHTARRHEEENRLEQALAEYHAALDQDPLNPNLRLKIAMLQERLELYIDAWVTYEAIVDESDRRAWRGPDRRVYLLALYRLAVMLSNGRVATQWVKSASVAGKDGTLRDRERHERRAELLSSLENSPLFAPSRTKFTLSGLPVMFTESVSFLIAHPRAKTILRLRRTINGEANEPSAALAVFKQKGESRNRERAIETVLRILGLRRLEELETAMRIFSFSRRARRERRLHGPARRQRLLRPEFPRGAVRISKLLVTIRIAAGLEYEVTHPKPGRKLDNKDEWIAEIREGHRALTKRWPFPAVSRWRRTIHRLRPLRRWANRREDAWQLYYNAACAAAAVLRKDSVLLSSQRDSRKPVKRRRRPWRLMKLDSLEALPTGTTKDDITERAIELLEEYAFRAGSDRVAAQADWLAIDDSDLRGLRKEPEFKRWASHHLPRALPQEHSSRKADVKRFTIRIAREGAYAFATAWRERAFRDEAPTAAEVAEWWSVEADLWAELGNVWREHLSWQQRLRWLGILQDWLRDNGVEDEIEFGHEARGAAADAMHPELFAKLAELAGGKAESNGAGETGTQPSATLAWAGIRAERVRVAHEAGERQADARGALLAEAERREALKACRIWTRLAELLEVELTREVRKKETKEEQLARELVRDEELREALASIRAELSAMP